MTLKRRWLQSAMDETRKPLPKMPWQSHKLAVAAVKSPGLGEGRTTASA